MKTNTVKWTPLRIVTFDETKSFVLVQGQYVRISVDCQENYGDAAHYARLIAAAPEMYEALTMVQAHQNSVYDPAGELDDCEKCKAIIAKVKAALSKARGEV